jgi:hypothetical protein
MERKRKKGKRKKARKAQGIPNKNDEEKDVEEDED